MQHLSVHSVVAGPYILSAVVAGIVAYIVVRWLLGYLSKESHSTTPFIIYRIALGVALIFLAQIGFVAVATAYNLSGRPASEGL